MFARPQQNISRGMLGGVFGVEGGGVGGTYVDQLRGSPFVLVLVFCGPLLCG